MTRKKKAPVVLTVDQRIEWGTDDSIELVTSWLGATPDMPGGCQTVGRVMLKGTRVISVELLSWLARRAKQAEALEAHLKLTEGETP